MKKYTFTHSDRITANALAGSKISVELLGKESALYKSKWFDYRFMPAMEATQLFTDSFIEITKRNHAVYYDLDEAKLKMGITHEKIFECSSTTVTGMWKARQKADELGIPYSFYINYIFTHLMERLYQQLPRPNQLYSGHAVEAIELKWKDLNNAVFHKSYDPRYKSENYVGSKAQDDYHKYLIDNIKARPRSEMALAACCFFNKTLPIKLATEEFGEEFMTKAKNSEGYDGNDSIAGIDETDFKPSCFGLPFAQADDCVDCSYSIRCLNDMAEVFEIINKETGSDNPKDERKRTLARERQRKRRARVKEERKSVGFSEK